MLGLNSYPVDDDRTGPQLLEALAAAWVTRESAHWTIRHASLGRYVMHGGILTRRKGSRRHSSSGQGHRTFSTRAQR